jgi:6-phosphofructokinase 1
MGRHAGWIAAYAGIAGGADIILVPEKPVDMEQVIAVLKRNRAQGRTYNIVVVSEGITFEPGAYVTVKEGELDEFGHVRLGGVGNLVAEVIEKHTGYETRCVVLGHLQRGGPPTAFDRVLATRLGYAAAELVVTGQFGKMAALRGNTIVAADLAEAVGETKTLDMELFKVAEAFFTVD